MTTVASSLKSRHNRDGTLMTPQQVAWLLDIDIATVRLWKVLGVLGEAGSDEGSGRFRRAEVLTFLEAPCTTGFGNKSVAPTVWGRERRDLSRIPAIEGGDRIS